MKPSCILKLLIIFGVAAYLFKKTANKFIEGVSFVTGRISFSGISLAGVSLKIILTYRNDNPVPVIFDSFVGNLVYGPTILTNLTSNNINLAARSNSDITVNAGLDFLKLTSDVIEAIKNKSFQHDLRVVGTIYISGIGWPVDEPLTLI